MKLFNDDDSNGLHYTNVTCSSFDTLITVDKDTNVEFFTSIAIGVDGIPIISYYDNWNGDLKVVTSNSGFCIA